MLAVIAILAALLIPKIFESISSARIGATLLSCQTIKTAVLEHYGKFLSLASSNGVALNVVDSYDGFDGILLAEGLIDKPFDPKMGSSAVIRLRNVASYTAATSVDPRDGFSAYDLDGDGINDIVGTQFLVEATISGLTVADAKALNDSLDGALLGESASGQDFKGRLTYHKSGSNPLVVHIYLTHH